MAITIRGKPLVLFLKPFFRLLNKGVSSGILNIFGKNAVFTPRNIILKIFKLAVFAISLRAISTNLQINLLWCFVCFHDSI